MTLDNNLKLAENAVLSVEESLSKVFQERSNQVFQKLENILKIFKEEKDDEREEQYLNKVILLNPLNEEALYLLTLLQIKKSDYEESNKLINKFKKICKKICNKESELKLKLKSIQTN